MKNIKCIFTSVWSDGSEITTNCELDPRTGEVFPESVDIDPDGTLECEYITLESGEEIPVCMDCHSFILQTVMIPDEHTHDLHEVKECKNPDCDNKA